MYPESMMRLNRVDRSSYAYCKHIHTSIGSRERRQNDTPTPVTRSNKNESLERTNSISETNGSLTRVTFVNGWVPAVYISYMSQNFRLLRL